MGISTWGIIIKTFSGKIIVLIAFITSASISIGTHMRSGSRSRFGPVPIPSVISTLPSTFVSVLGTAPRLRTFSGATPVSPVSVHRSTA